MNSKISQWKLLNQRGKKFSASRDSYRFLNSRLWIRGKANSWKYWDAFSPYLSNIEINEMKLASHSKTFNIQQIHSRPKIANMVELHEEKYYLISNFEWIIEEHDTLRGRYPCQWIVHDAVLKNSMECREIEVICAFPFLDAKPIARNTSSNTVNDPQTDTAKIDL